MLHGAVSSVAEECRVNLLLVAKSAAQPPAVAEKVFPAWGRQRPFARPIFRRQHIPKQNTNSQTPAYKCYDIDNCYRSAHCPPNLAPTSQTPDTARGPQHCEAEQMNFIACCRVFIEIIHGLMQNVGIYQRWESMGNSCSKTLSGRTHKPTSFDSYLTPPLWHPHVRCQLSPRHRPRHPNPHEHPGCGPPLRSYRCWCLQWDRPVRHCYGYTLGYPFSKAYGTYLSADRPERITTQGPSEGRNPTQS